MATTKKAATKRPTKKTTSASTAKQTPAKKTAKETSTARSPKRVPLREREPKVLLEDAGYAVTGVLGDVVDLARDLPVRAGSLWRQVETSAKETPKRVKTLRNEAPTKLETQWTELRERLVKDGDRFITSFEKVFDGKAAEGRKLAEQVKQDERIATVLDRTTTSRSQVKAAVTSATKTADVAIDAGKKQLDVARSQAKGAVTAASKAPEKARAAAKPQAENAKTKAKAAATSTKRTADKVADEVVESAS